MAGKSLATSEESRLGDLRMEPPPILEGATLYSRRPFDRTVKKPEKIEMNSLTLLSKLVYGCFFRLNLPSHPIKKCESNA